jgi:Mycothiol maleylpyruvate isomerase N-terminal domain
MVADRVARSYPEAGLAVFACSSRGERARSAPPRQILADMVLDGFVRALDGFEAVLAGVAPDRWDSPSPCAGWYAVDVAGHVISDLRAVEHFAPMARSFGLIGPECAVSEDADDLTRCPSG